MYINSKHLGSQVST